ncbi:PA0069 family radical SAM protein [Sagittula sp. SSi028]|uniref:PA0069 family radical SAM protein n=1 Tax=Sagittula sp. SSi028 TaxID=3400636 RepID=UPI003AF542AC
MEQSDRILEQERRRGRGALTCAPGRFERHDRVAVQDGWDIAEELTPLRTEIREERARSIINYVSSPDLPFDRSINPFRGCEHGCVYCFARPSHAYMGMSPGLDFETRLTVRRNAPEQLAKELSRPGYKVAPIAIGTNTDPYQPVERDEGVMRACLEVLADHQHPVAIVTKGAMIERDLDILAPMAEAGLVRVGISVTSLDAKLSRRMEPRCPSPQRRLQTIEQLVEAGIPVRVMASPLVPGLTDHELEQIIERAAEAGATSASYIMLRLPREVAGLWEDWLKHHYPNRFNRVMGHLRDMHGGAVYSAQWHKRMRGEGSYADLIAQRFRRVIRRLGIDAAQPALRCDLFRIPPRTGDQLDLF